MEEEANEGPQSLRLKVGPDPSLTVPPFANWNNSWTAYLNLNWLDWEVIVKEGFGSVPVEPVW